MQRVSRDTSWPKSERPLPLFTEILHGPSQDCRVSNKAVTVRHILRASQSASEVSYIGMASPKQAL